MEGRLSPQSSYDCLFDRYIRDDEEVEMDQQGFCLVVSGIILDEALVCSLLVKKDVLDYLASPELLKFLTPANCQEKWQQLMEYNFNLDVLVLLKHFGGCLLQGEEGIRLFSTCYSVATGDSLGSSYAVLALAHLGSHLLAISKDEWRINLAIARGKHFLLDNWVPGTKNPDRLWAAKILHGISYIGEDYVLAALKVNRVNLAGARGLNPN
ncbi:hypothetical protein BDW62DRAFT_205031 [Aspergillus aurantiobrunneus]